MDEMAREDVDRVLNREGFGMLAMSDGTTPYVIPMSFGYDGTACHIQMSETGRKNDVIAENPHASLSVLSIDDDSGSSESVVVEGLLEPVPETDLAEAMAALAGNAEFGSDLSVWGVPVKDVELGVYRLVPERVSGRRFGTAETPR